jgi:hypothetical protein
MLSELRAELDQLAEAILTRERLAAGRGKRRRRPAAWMTAIKGQTTSSKNKPKEGNRDWKARLVLPAFTR